MPKLGGRSLSFGRRKSKSQPLPKESEEPPSGSATDRPLDRARSAFPRSASIFSRGGGKAKSELAATVPEHDGGMVGKDVVIRKLQGREDVEGVRGEAVLYDFYERMYHVLLYEHGQRVHAPPESLNVAKKR